MNQNTTPETLAVVDENHAASIKHAMFDTEVDASYITFCGCKNGETHNLISSTIYSMLYDMDETGTHVIGLEILIFPKEGFRRGALDADLALTRLTVEQREAVINKLIQ